MPTAWHGWGKVSLSEVKAQGGAWTGTCVCRALRIAFPPPPQVLEEHKHRRNQSWAHFPDSPCGRQPCRDPALPALRVKSWPGHITAGGGGRYGGSRLLPSCGTVSLSLSPFSLANE